MLQEIFNFTIRRSAQLTLLQRLVLRAAYRAKLDLQLALSQLQTYISKLSPSQSQITQCIVRLLAQYVQANWTGPVLTSLPAQMGIDLLNNYQRKRFQQPKFQQYKDSFKALADRGFDENLLRLREFIQMQVQQADKALSLGGQNWNKSRLSSLFLVLKSLVCRVQQPIMAALLKARMSLLHLSGLDQPVQQLVNALLENYKLVSQFMDKHQEQFSKPTILSFRAEYSKAILPYYKYEQSLCQIQKAKRLLKVRYSFGARLGVRTKFQTFTTPQLVVQKTKDDSYQLEESKQIQKGLLLLEGLKLQNQNFDAENILLEQPKLEGQQTIDQVQLSEVFVILAEVVYLLKTVPRDEILFMQVDSFLNKIWESLKQKMACLKGVLWPSFLFHRSQNQFQRVKRSERAISQIEQLIVFINNYNDQPNRLPFVFGSSFPTLRQLILSLANKYLKMGLVVASSQLFQSMGMMEECVECLAASRHTDQAQKLALKLLQQKRTPKLLCLLGDLTGQRSWYQSAWQESGQKFSRAQRALGMIYFQEKNYEKSVKAFKNALDLNPYHPGAWFTRGCAENLLALSAQAAVSFTKVVCIDSTQGEAWANLANCYSKQGKLAQAVSCLQQAVKHCQSNWKIWANYMNSCLPAKKFYKYFECIQRLLSLGKKEQITMEIVTRVNQTYMFKLKSIGNLRLQEINSFENRISRLYEVLKAQLGEKSFVWKSYSEFLDLVVYKTSQIKVKYEHSPQSLPVPAQELDSFIKSTISQLLQQALESRLKECNMISVVGWQSREQSCRQLQTCLSELKQLQKRLGLKSEQIRLLCQSAKGKIAVRLGRQPCFINFI